MIILRNSNQRKWKHKYQGRIALLQELTLELVMQQLRVLHSGFDLSPMFLFLEFCFVFFSMQLHVMVNDFNFSTVVQPSILCVAIRREERLLFLKFNLKQAIKMYIWRYNLFVFVLFSSHLFLFLNRQKH